MIEKVKICLNDDGTPVVGGIFDSEEDATFAVRNYIALAKEKQKLSSSDSIDEEISLEFIRQSDRRFKMLVNFGCEIGYVAELANIDELMLKRFKKHLAQKYYFILTSFFEEEDRLVSTISKRSLGLIIYKF